MVDIFLVLLLPGGGDELQGIKKGIIEIADIIAINKADGDNRQRAERSAADYRAALGLLTPTSANWQPPVLAISGLTNLGATLEKLDKWGVREFAYEMKKANRGFYVVLEFLAPNALPEIDRVLRLADEVIRHKTVRLPLDEAHRRGLVGATA